MKRPLLDQEQRLDIMHDSFYGSKLRLHLSVLQFKRELHRSFIKLFKL